MVWFLEKREPAECSCPKFTRWAIRKIRFVGGFQTFLLSLPVLPSECAQSKSTEFVRQSCCCGIRDV